MIPLRLVVDTNILVSAALKPAGLPRTVISIAATKPARWYLSPAILAEYRGVISRPELHIRRGLQLQLLQLIKIHSHIVQPTRLLHATIDPEDSKFIECADVARADYLVTGNLRHFPKFWKKTKVITSREFISLVAPHVLV